MSKEYRYSLEKKSKKQVCPQCGKKTFVRYIDNHTNDYLPEIYGRCDREQKCAYHLNPYKDGYAKSNHHPYGVKIHPKKEPKEKPVFIPEEVLNDTLQGYGHNVFIQNLLHRVNYPFAVRDIEQVISLYYLGSITGDYMNGGITFPYIDINGKIRAIQIKQFDESNHTTKTGFFHTMLEHKFKRTGEPTLLWLDKYSKQDKIVSCLFGEHLLKRYPFNPIALVEAPKTAIYGTLYFGCPKTVHDFLWLAVYNKSSFSLDRIRVLHGKDVYVFPDLSSNGKTFKEWQEKAKIFENQLPGTRFIFSDLLERFSNEMDKYDGLDLADYLIKLDWKTFRKQDNFDKI